MNVENYVNPFPNDKDRSQIWDMLVKKDIIAFLKQDWEMVAEDFIAQNFMGIDACHLGNPDSWRMNFANLDDYKTVWLEQASEFAKTTWSGDPEEDMYDATSLRDIDIKDDSALIHKKFDGHLVKEDGSKQILNWQTLYRCKKLNGTWKIAGFTGYMPHPLGHESKLSPIGKQIPEGASQHKTAGPYSPVLQVTPGKMVVISGQAAIDNEGKVVGESIEEQTEFTLKNCLTQLQTAGVSFDDVFKVNVYLTDLDNWPRFNEVYKTHFKDPKPVRTAVQTPLLYNFLVEIEMWAVTK